jgi:dTMP kinase
MSRAKGFISFEGIEGSGKSTQSRLFADYLLGKGHDVVHTAEPGGTDIGLKIRKLLLEPNNHMDALTELLLYYASRAQHVQEVINPAMRENKIVITDRFTDSTVAYQGYARGLSMDIIQSLNDIVLSDLTPDMTFLLDMDVREGLRRNRDAMKEDRFELETVAFHERVRQGFHEIAEKEPGRIKIIDASKSKEEVTGQIIKVFEQSWH